jgi:hypothetical protein
MKDRTSLVELFVSAVMVALGINILATKLVGTWNEESTWVAVGCLVAPLALLVIRAYATDDRSERIRGFFVYRERDNSVVTVPRYGYGEALAGFARRLMEEDGTREASEVAAEATERWVLDKLQRERVLPEGSRIRQIDRRTTRVGTRWFAFTVSVVSDGLTAALPYRFAEIALPGEVSAYSIDLHVMTRVKLPGLSFPAGRQRQRRLHAFVEALTDDFSQDAFFERIGWEKAVTVAEAAAVEPRGAI